MLRPFNVLLLGAVVAFMTACNPQHSEKAKVMRVLQVRAQAINARNIDLYLTIISPDYSDKGKNMSQLQDGLETGFKIYDSANYQADEQKVIFKGNKAEVTGSYRLKVVIRGREMVLAGQEHLVLTRESGDWKIVAGL